MNAQEEFKTQMEAHNVHTDGLETLLAGKVSKVTKEDLINRELQILGSALGQKVVLVEGDLERIYGAKDDYFQFSAEGVALKVIFGAIAGDNQNISYLPIPNTDFGIVFEKPLAQMTQDQRAKVLKQLPFLAYNLSNQEKATYDDLTKLYSRGTFNTFFNRQMAGLERKAHEEGTLTEDHAVILFDLDHFKHVNDTYGHVVGDELLRKVGEAIRTTLPRQSDFVARYGGEEFVGFLPSTNLHGALIAAERVRQAINKIELEIDHPDGSIEIYKPTASFGAYSLKQDLDAGSLGTKQIAIDNHLKPETVLKKADWALYEAKETGRNQTVVYCREILLD